MRSLNVKIHRPEKVRLWISIKHDRLSELRSRTLKTLAISIAACANSTRCDVNTPLSGIQRPDPHTAFDEDNLISYLAELESWLMQMKQTPTVSHWPFRKGAEEAPAKQKHPMKMQIAHLKGIPHFFFFFFIASNFWQWFIDLGSPNDAPLVPPAARGYLRLLKNLWSGFGCVQTTRGGGLTARTPAETRDFYLQETPPSSGVL